MLSSDGEGNMLVFLYSLHCHSLISSSSAFLLFPLSSYSVSFLPLSLDTKCSTRVNVLSIKPSVAFRMYISAIHSLILNLNWLYITDHQPDRLEPSA